MRTVSCLADDVLVGRGHFWLRACVRRGGRDIGGVTVTGNAFPTVHRCDLMPPWRPCQRRQASGPLPGRVVWGIVAVPDQRPSHISGALQLLAVCPWVTGGVCHVSHRSGGFRGFRVLGLWTLEPKCGVSGGGGGGCFAQGHMMFGCSFQLLGCHLCSFGGLGTGSAWATPPSPSSSAFVVPKQHINTWPCAGHQLWPCP